MKYLTITLIFLASATISCKKKKGQYCYFEAMKGSNSIYTWPHNKPSNVEVQKVQDTCGCTVTIKETCVPCDGTFTDAAGNDIGCN